MQANDLTALGATRSGPRRSGLIGLALAALILAGAAPTAGAATPPADFAFDFQTTTPGAPADAALHILYRDPENPDDPEAQPPALTEVRIEAPAGTVFDGDALPACPATDGEIQLQGPSACPEDTVVGRGFGSVEDTAAGGRYVLDAVLFNAGDAVIEVFTFQGTDQVAAVDRASYEGRNTMVLHPAVVPGITEREFAWTYMATPPAATGSFVTTPPRCPRSGVWESELEYSVTTGATYAVKDTTPCRRPRIAVELSPNNVGAGERSRVRVRLSSPDPRCVDGARVRLGGRFQGRSDTAGRAEIVVAMKHPGERRVRASKRGCRTGSARLGVG
jgi:hypothetical protein